MPVNKVDGLVLRKGRIAFDIIPRSTVDAIGSAEALAIWTYLITRPENWVVKRNDIMKRLGLGRDRYARAMRELTDLGLIQTTVSRNDDGTLAGRMITVNPIQPNIQVSDMSEIPTFGKSAHLKNKGLNKKQKNVGNNRSTRFNDWWSVYPKKVGKKACLAKWKSRNLDEIADRLIDDVTRRISQDRRWIEGYIPNPLTYINQDRWEDEIEPMLRVVQPNKGCTAADRWLAKQGGSK
ncbi:hypothetical protein D6779_09920 [Candidatus Parcubacteria bacterium]|nr:MAG: hypothetical protein D6779_09920 [Candidatus Parcubacteria bacterium]